MLTTDNLQNLADFKSHFENVDYLDVKNQSCFIGD